MLRRNLVAVVVAAVVLGAGAVAWAQGQTEPTSAGSQQEGSPPEPPGDEGKPAEEGAAREGRAGRRQHRGAGVLRRAVHGDLVVPKKEGEGFEEVTFDRGDVTAVDGDSIVVKRPDGVSVEKRITAETRFRGVRTAQEVQVGTRAMVVSRGDEAVTIRQMTDEQRRRLEERRRERRERRRGGGNTGPASGVNEGEEQVPAA